MGRADVNRPASEADPTSGVPRAVDRQELRVTREQFDIPEGIIYGVPVTTENGEYKRVEGLEIDAFSRERMDHTLNELLEERDGVKDLLG